MRVAFSVRGATKELSLPSSVTLGELGAQIEEQTGIAASTMKLLVVRRFFRHSATMGEELVPSHSL